MIAKARETILRYTMLEQGESVAVGVSGGADSVALLLFLVGIKAEYQLQISAVHLNHSLRGAESDGDQAFVEELCRRLQVPLTTAQRPIAALAKEQGLSIEEAARQERYQLFAAAKTNKIATAHTLSDSVETTLFHLVRGTGPQGLTGIPPVRDRIIRPLIHCTRQQVEEYLKEEKQDYRTDSSNLTPKYTRNFIRLEIMPQLEKINPRVERSIETLQLLLAQDANYLERQTQLALQETRQGEHEYAREGYLRQDPALQGRMLRALLQQYGIAYDKKKVDTIHQFIVNGTGSVQLSSSWFCRCKEKSFLFANPVEEMPKSFSQLSLDITQTGKSVVDFQGKTVNIHLIDYEEFENIAKNKPNYLKNVVDYDKIDKALLLRSRKAGDRYKPYRRGGTKKLKDLFSAAGLSRVQRSETLIIEDSQGIVWVEGFGAREQAAVMPTSKRIIVIEIKGEQPL